MTINDPKTLDAVAGVSQTADRLARRMGGHYVMKAEWRQALEDLKAERGAALPTSTMNSRVHSISA